MRHRFSINMLMVFVIQLVACAPVPGASSLTPVITAVIPESGSTATASEIEAVTPTIEAVTETPSSTELPVITETPTSAVGSQITFMVNRSGASPYLVDQQGRSLYAYLNDTPYSSTSICLDDCAVEWPPVTVSGVPTAGEGVDSTLISTFSRADGSIQAAYNGWPLYYYNMDTIPGTTYGQRYNGVWFLISPSGDPIQRY